MGPKAKLIGLFASVAVTAVVTGTVLGASTAVTASNVDVIKKTSASVNLNNSPHTNTTIAQVSLPAGAWVVTADVSVVNYGASDYVRCGVYAGSTGLGGQTTVIGGTTPVANIAVLGAIKTTSTKTFSLRCNHDSAVPGIYADGGAELWAHKSSSLTLPN